MYKLSCLDQHMLEKGLFGLKVMIMCDVELVLLIFI